MPMPIEDRIEIAEKALAGLTGNIRRVEEPYERASLAPLSVPISTFAPEPFEIVRDFSVVVRYEDDGFVATLFDANISSSGSTREEAVANVKDLILMIFEDSESEPDGDLGPAMIRQKYALRSLIRRK